MYDCNEMIKKCNGKTGKILLQQQNTTFPFLNYSDPNEVKTEEQFAINLTNMSDITQFITFQIKA